MSSVEPAVLAAGVIRACAAPTISSAFEMREEALPSKVSAQPSPRDGGPGGSVTCRPRRTL